MGAVGHETLTGWLTRLQLTAIRDQLDSLLDEAAGKEMTLREVSRKDERRLHLPFEPHAAHLFFQLVSRRYERGGILITSNRLVGEWGEVFGDTVVATAILDRLLHHSHVLMITGESFRLREKRRAGLRLTAAPGGGTRQETT